MKTLTEEIEGLFRYARKRRNRSHATNFKEPFYNNVTARVIRRIDKENVKKQRTKNKINFKSLPKESVTYMDISFLCPSRERVNNIDKIINSLSEVLSDKLETEILFKFDEDDKITINHTFTLNKKISIDVFIDKRSDELNKNYYNFLATKAQSNYLWAIGDDLVFHTKQFDVILKEKLEAYLQDKPDRIAYISVTEKGSKAKHPCFPIITKEAFNVLGMYFHPQLLSWGADRCIYEVYSGIDRILHIPEIEIEHISYHDNKAPYDKTAQSMKERFFRNKNCHNEVSKNIIPNQIKQLQKYINEYNKPL